MADPPSDSSFEAVEADVLRSSQHPVVPIESSFEAVEADVMRSLLQRETSSTTLHHPAEAEAEPTTNIFATNEDDDGLQSAPSMLHHDPVSESIPVHKGHAATPDESLPPSEQGFPPQTVLPRDDSQSSDEETADREVAMIVSSGGVPEYDNGVDSNETDDEEENDDDDALIDDNAAPSATVPVAVTPRTSEGKLDYDERNENDDAAPSAKAAADPASDRRPDDDEKENVDEEASKDERVSSAKVPIAETIDRVPAAAGDDDDDDGAEQGERSNVGGVSMGEEEQEVESTEDEEEDESTEKGSARNGEEDGSERKEQSRAAHDTEPFGVESVRGHQSMPVNSEADDVGPVPPGAPIMADMKGDQSVTPSVLDEKIDDALSDDDDDIGVVVVRRGSAVPWLVGGSIELSDSQTDENSTSSDATVRPAPLKDNNPPAMMALSEPVSTGAGGPSHDDDSNDDDPIQQPLMAVPPDDHHRMGLEEEKSPVAIPLKEDHEVDFQVDQSEQPLMAVPPSDSGEIRRPHDEIHRDDRSPQLPNSDDEIHRHDPSPSVAYGETVNVPVFYVDSSDEEEERSTAANVRPAVPPLKTTDYSSTQKDASDTEEESTNRENTVDEFRPTRDSLTDAPSTDPPNAQERRRFDSDSETDKEASQSDGSVERFDTAPEDAVSAIPLDNDRSPWPSAAEGPSHSTADREHEESSRGKTDDDAPVEGYGELPSKRREINDGSDDSSAEEQGLPIRSNDRESAGEALQKVYDEVPVEGSEGLRPLETIPSHMDLVDALDRSQREIQDSNRSSMEERDDPRGRSDDADSEDDELLRKYYPPAPPHDDYSDNESDNDTTGSNPEAIDKMATAFSQRDAESGSRRHNNEEESKVVVTAEDLRRDDDEEDRESVSSDDSEKQNIEGSNKVSPMYNAGDGDGNGSGEEMEKGQEVNRDNNNGQFIMPEPVENSPGRHDAFGRHADSDDGSEPLGAKDGMESGSEIMPESRDDSEDGKKFGRQSPEEDQNVHSNDGTEPLVMNGRAESGRKPTGVDEDNSDERKAPGRDSPEDVDSDDGSEPLSLDGHAENRGNVVAVDKDSDRSHWMGHTPRDRDVTDHDEDSRHTALPLSDPMQPSTTPFIPPLPPRSMPLPPLRTSSSNDLTSLTPPPSGPVLPPLFDSPFHPPRRPSLPPLLSDTSLVPPKLASPSRPGLESEKHASPQSSHRLNPMSPFDSPHDVRRGSFGTDHTDSKNNDEIPHRSVGSDRVEGGYEAPHHQMTHLGIPADGRSGALLSDEVPSLSNTERSVVRFGGEDNDDSDDQDDGRLRRGVPDQQSVPAEGGDGEGKGNSQLTYSSDEEEEEEGPVREEEEGRRRNGEGVMDAREEEEEEGRPDNEEGSRRKDQGEGGEGNVATSRTASTTTGADESLLMVEPLDRQRGDSEVNSLAEEGLESVVSSARPSVSGRASPVNPPAVHPDHFPSPQPSSAVDDPYSASNPAPVPAPLTEDLVSSWSKRLPPTPRNLTPRLSASRSTSLSMTPLVTPRITTPRMATPRIITPRQAVITPNWTPRAA